MNERPSGLLNDKAAAASGTKGMHDIDRSIIMGGSSGQTAIVTTTTTSTPGNGIANPVLETAGNSSNATTNGVHHHHSLVATSTVTSSAAVAGIAPTTTTSGAFLNNNNCLKRSQVIKKCSGGGRISEETHSVEEQQVHNSSSHGRDARATTMSDGPPDEAAVNAQRPEAVHTLTVSSASSTSSSAVSSRSSSLSTSPNPMMLIRGAEDVVEEVEDSRKVEPLKINLHHREPIRTVIKLGGQSPEVSSLLSNHTQSTPKITFKPIPNTVPVVSSTNEASSAEEDAIPKLHIRMNHQAETGGTPPEAIPKLTIRNATTSAAAVETGPAANTTGATTTAENTVPKLTIKMGQPLVKSPVPRLTIKTNSSGGHAIGDGATPNDILTVPKLTIKVSNDQPSSVGAGGVLSPGSAMISSSTSNSSAAAATALPVDGSILKLTLKNVSRSAVDQVDRQALQPDEATSSFQIVGNDVTTKQAVVPKLKVKLPPRPTSRVPSSVDEVEEEEEDEEQSERSEEEEKVVVVPPRIPKLTIKSLVSPPKTHVTNPAGVNEFVAAAVSGGGQHQKPQHHHHHPHHHHHHPEVPKLVIKSIPKPEHVTGENSSQYHATNHRDVLPLDVCTATAAPVGPQSPRIILKINKNQNSIVSNTTELNIEATTGEENNLLKRHLLQDHVNSTPKRSKAEERIIAVIDLDEEDAKSDGDVAIHSQVEKNGRPSRRLMLSGAGDQKEDEEEDEGQDVEEEEEEELQAADTHSAADRKAGKKLSRISEGVTTNNCTQIVPEHQPVGGDGEQKKGTVDAATMRLQAPEETPDDLHTPVVKRGRGRPRKTPVVVREVAENDSSNNSNFVIVPETSKKRGRKKKEEENDTQVPAVESVNAVSDEESLPSPAPFSSASTRKPRGGGTGRGGGSARTPSTRGGSAARRGRGTARKPFNKQQYFKQKTFEQNIISSYFEEDTRMSGADSSLSTPKVASSVVSQNDAQDSVSQSSHLSSTSVTMDSTQTSSLPARKKLKMEVVGTMEGKIEFTVDMLAEYDWPPGVGCCPNKNRDTFMIQEQIAEYLGVKSFKRKYPDLERRTVEMEERNHLIERGLVTEKMCDLGVTAVYALDVLDIMHQDFHEKYEQYKKYHREKLAKDLTIRQKMNKLELGIGAREKAMRSVSKWNASLNRTRKEDRRTHMDLQNFTIQVPEARRKTMTCPTQTPSLYPVALVVGQFSEYYRTYSPQELQCYPINSALTNPDDLMKRLLEEKMKKRSEEEEEATASAQKAKVAEAVAKSVSSESSSSEEEEEEEEGSVDSDEDESVDSSSSESDYDVHDDDVCCVCTKSQFTSPNEIPELFVKCAICMKVAHPSCIEMSSEMAKRAFQYQWQCVDCKRCHSCQKSDGQQKMIYCQQCDRAYHIYCTKSLQSIPKGMWHCDICSICRKCGCRNPDGTNNKQPKPVSLPTGHPHHRRPDWRHEFVKNEATGLKEHCGMLCTRCVASSSGPSS